MISPTEDPRRSQLDRKIYAVYCPIAIYIHVKQVRRRVEIGVTTITVNATSSPRSGPNARCNCAAM